MIYLALLNKVNIIKDVGEHSHIIMIYKKHIFFIGHPKTRLLIYHGGAAGVYEAVSHGVPLLIMPLAADHRGNAARVIDKGFARSIDKNTVTEAEFKDAITDMLTDPK